MCEKTREKKVKEHEEKEKKKITFIGNDLLSGIYDLINENYINKKILVDNYNYNDLKKLLSDNTISNNIVIVLDNSITISSKQYQELVNLFKDKNITIISTNDLSKIDGARVINFNSTNYTTFDRVHLTDSGNSKLFTLIKNNIKED